MEFTLNNRQIYNEEDQLPREAAAQSLGGMTAEQLQAFVRMLETLTPDQLGRLIREGAGGRKGAPSREAFLQSLEVLYEEEITRRILEESERTYLEEKKRQEDRMRMMEMNVNRNQFVSSSSRILEKRCHILVNSSDIFFNAPKKDLSIRMNPQELANVIKRNRRIEGIKMVVGTKPAPNNHFWNIWKSEGFDTLVGRENIITSHLQSLIEGLDHGSSTLVLCVGESLANMEDHLTRVLELNSHVDIEVWTWRDLPSPMRLNIPRRVTFYYLDDHTDKIFFQSPEKRKEKSKHSERSGNQPKGSTSEISRNQPKGSAGERVGHESKRSAGSPGEGDINECVICLSQPRTHIVVPCGHFIACSDCIQDYTPGKQCPICRAVVQSVHRVHIA